MNCSPVFPFLDTTLQILTWGGLIIFLIGLLVVVVRLITWLVYAARGEKEKRKRVGRKLRGEVAVTVIAVLVAGGAGWGGVSISLHFNDWSTYTKQYPVLATTQPVIRGKILVVQTVSSLTYHDTGGGQAGLDPSLSNSSTGNTGPTIDGSFCDFPDALRATSDSEVGTVIWMEWSRVHYADYCEEGSQFVVNGVSGCSAQSEAYAHSCQVSVINLKEKGIVYQHTYTGSAPETPQSYSGTGDLAGSSPIPEIVAFVVSLPRAP